MTRRGIEPESTVSVADALSTRPLIGLLRQIYAKQMVASNFAKNQENFKGELCLNVITPFTIIVFVLQ